MSTEAAFLAAALPEPQVLLRQELEPYSVGHELILRRLQSPFLSEVPYKKSELIAKLFTAVYVCCHTYDAAVAALRKPTLDETFKAWRKACGAAVGAPAEGEKLVLSFLKYLKAGRECPEFSRSTHATQKPGAPFLLALLNVLQGELGFTRTEALNCPFGLARWHYCAYYETQGRLTIRDPESLERIRKRMAELGLRPIRFAGQGRK